MTEANIYSAPADDSYSLNASLEKREHYLSVAKRQKCVLLSFFFYLVMSFFSGVFGSFLQPMLSLFSLGLFLTMIAFNISLIWRTYGIIGRIILIGFSMIPGINLFAVLAANSRANHLLKTAGFRVGLLGADIEGVEKPH